MGQSLFLVSRLLRDVEEVARVIGGQLAGVRLFKQVLESCWESAKRKVNFHVDGIHALVRTSDCVDRGFGRCPHVSHNRVLRAVIAATTSNVVEWYLFHQALGLLVKQR